MPRAGGRAQRPARARFTPRLEDLEGRETPAGAGGGVVSLSIGDGFSALGTRRAGEEVPARIGHQLGEVEFDAGVDPMGKAATGGGELGVGVEPMTRPSNALPSVLTIHPTTPPRAPVASCAATVAAQLVV